MAVLVGAVLIIALLIFLGVDLWYICVGVVSIIALFAVILTGFFAWCTIRLTRSEKHEAVLKCVDEETRFDCAVYIVDGNEYHNSFPCEMVLKEKLYKPGRTAVVRLTKNKKTIFDTNAFYSVLVGLPVCAALSVGSLLALLYLFGFFSK